MLYRRFVNFTDKNSINYKMRQTRLRMFVSVVSNLPKPVKVLDVGGSVYYWENLFFAMEGVKREDYDITITNIEEAQMNLGQDGGESDFKMAKLDARDMSRYGDNEFDIVHSNSVIEHVGDEENRMKMATEVRRVGRYHFVQTPNYWFPIEPHFRALFFHWLPKAWRVKLVMTRKMGHLQKATTVDEAIEIVDSAQLMDYNETRKCFPLSSIWREKFLGVTKSFVVIGKGD